MTEYDANGNSIRSISGLGTNPSGFDVDAAGNVYVSITDSNQIWKLNPTSTSFAPDNGFGYLGVIGGTGTNDGLFDTPIGVAVASDGQSIAIADSNNHRIQRIAANGNFKDTFGTQGSALGQFNSPKGLAYDAVGTLYVVDSGNNRLVMSSDSSVIGVTGTNGTALGQFQGLRNVSINKRGVYVADTGNGRVQKFDPVDRGVFNISTLNLGYAVSSGLSQPAAVAAAFDPLDEKFYVADTGHDRVVLYQLPRDNPVPPWTNFVTKVATGDLTAAVTSFSNLAADKYRRAFQALGTNDLNTAIGQIGTLTTDYIVNAEAEAYFTNVIDGQTITFPVQFVKENGVWKIAEF